MRLLARFLRDRCGNAAMMGALVLPPAMILTAIAIDQGALYREKRMLQGVTDLAALSASGLPGQASQIALATIQRNGVSANAGSAVPSPTSEDAQVLVQTGRYTSSSALDAQARFEPGATLPNSVQVTVRRRGTLHFGTSLIDRPLIETVGVARTTNGAGVSIGSRLARLDGGIANAILSSLLDTRLSLSAMDYRALADARIELLPMLTMLGPEIGVEAGTYRDVLKAEASPGTIAAALVKLPHLGSAVTTPLRKLASTSRASPLPLSKLIALDPTLENKPLGLGGAGLEVSALQLLQAAALLSNGDHIATVDLGANIPGLLGATLSVAVGEPPQALFGIAEEGSTVRTAQTRLLLDLKLLGAGGALGASVNLPLYVELAYAEAKLTAIACRTGRREPARVDLSARPGIAEIRIASVDPRTLDRWSRPPAFDRAKLVSLPAVEATGSARIASEGATVPLSFGSAEIDRRAVKTVSTRTPTSSLVSSLLKETDLEIRVLGLGLPLGATLKPLLASSLTDAAKPVDALLMSVLDTLGVSVGEADVAYLGGSCGSAVLVR